MGLRGFQIVALVMPVAAMSLSLGRTGKRASRGIYGWASVSRRRSAVALTGVLAVLAASTYILLPNGDYEPIRPGERGTLGEAVRGLPATTAGRPAFTPEHATRFAPVPTEREQRSPVESQRAPAQRQIEQGATRKRQLRGTSTEDKPAPGRDPRVVKDRPASDAPTTSAPSPTATPISTATRGPTATATPEATATPTPEEPAVAATP
jgi:hypothetical protein